MQQALHIFRKDVRHLWPWSSVVLILIALHAVIDVVHVEPPFGLAGSGSTPALLNALLPLVFSLYVAWLIFDEPLPGDRQFWITRPYSRPQLLSSKLLFVFLFINVPLFISDCCILATQGFPVVRVIPRLLLRQIIMTVIFVLPSFAIATFTKGMQQFLLAWFILLIVWLSQSTLLSRLHGLGIIPGDYLLTIVGFAAVVVILEQYAFGRTNTARAVAVIAVVLIPLLVSGNQVRKSPDEPSLLGQSKIQIAYDLTESGRSEAINLSRDFNLRLPLAVSGLSPGELLRGTTRTVIRVEGRDWPQDRHVFNGSIQKIGKEYWQSVWFDDPKPTMAPRTRTSIQTDFDLEVVNDTPIATVSTSTKFFFVPLLGQCHLVSLIRDQGSLACRSGLENTVSTDAYVNSPDGRLVATFIPQPTPWGLSPTTDNVFSQNKIPLKSRLVFIPRRLISTLKRSVTLQNVDLTAYIGDK